MIKKLGILDIKKGLHEATLFYDFVDESFSYLAWFCLEGCSSCNAAF